MACRLPGAKPLSEPVMDGILFSGPRETRQWNYNQNTTLFIAENDFECVVWKMAAILLGLNVLGQFVYE